MRSVLCVLLAFLLLTFAGRLPFEIHDAAELNPIQTLEIKADAQGFLLRGENGQQGSGKTFDLAVEDLKRSTTGVAFLQTAQKLLLSGDTDSVIDQIIRSDALRPASEVYLASGQLDLEAITDYLSTRSSEVTLSDLRSAVLEGKRPVLPRLKQEGEKVELFA